MGDKKIWRGNNAPPVIWPIKTEVADGVFEAVDVSDLDFVLTITCRGKVLLERSTMGGHLQVVPYSTLLEPGDPGYPADPSLVDTVIWSPTEAESRLIPPGRVARYELGYQQPSIPPMYPEPGERRTVASGYFIGQGGNNAD